MPQEPAPRRYFDNAATSFPKPDVVADAMSAFALSIGASPGRGAFHEVSEAGRILDRCRERFNRMIGGSNPDHVIFTLNATDALNLAIKGIVRPLLRRGDPVHVLTTEMDHNSILRPFHALLSDGVQVTHIPVNPESGILDPDALSAAIRPDTRLVAVHHASNVTGTIQPLPAIASICREASIPLLVDAAQTVGKVPINVDAMGIDLLACPGHKGLLGPLGTGVLYIRPGLEDRLEPLREGGTGSRSDEAVQPLELPDRYEPGSPNAIGLAGLDAALGWILDKGVAQLWTVEQEHSALMLDGLQAIPGLRVLGPASPASRCGVFSITLEGIECEELAAVLESRYGILTRAGLHCAPMAHEACGTLHAGGATRLSLGPFLSPDDIAAATDAVAEISRTLAMADTP